MRKPISFLIFLLVLNCVGLVFQWYLNYAWFDVALHFSGGFGITWLFWVYLGDHLHHSHPVKDMLILVGTAVFIGVLWEFTEYLASHLLVDPIYQHYKVRAYFMGDLDDTVKDLFMDTLGALAFALTKIKKLS